MHCVTIEFSSCAAETEPYSHDRRVVPLIAQVSTIHATVAMRWSYLRGVLTYHDIGCSTCIIKATNLSYTPGFPTLASLLHGPARKKIFDYWIDLFCRVKITQSICRANEANLE